jgi:2-hydroxychromene-2-carboxylate isomerase
MHTLEFYFDCSSPWTYLAFENVQRVLAGLPVRIDWKPILVGGLFNTVNPSVYANREKPVPAKAAYARKDMQDWARDVGIVIGDPPVFPVNSVKAMRGAFLALDAGCLVPYARAVFEAYWRDLADISQDEVLRPLVRRVGLDEASFFTSIAEDTCKARLRESTDECMRRGGFGSPTFFLDGDDMYFGNDRLDLIARRITQS